MDKLYNCNKEILISLFKRAAEILKYDQIEFNPVTEKFNYRKKGTGLQWGASANISVGFIEKNGFTNATFSCVATKGLPLLENAKQNILNNWYKELSNTVEKLLIKIDNLDETRENVSNKEEQIKNDISNSTLVEQEIQNDIKIKNQKSNLVIIVIFSVLFIGLISFFMLNKGQSYESYQDFAKDNSELIYYNDIVKRFGNPNYDQNFSDYPYYTVYYKKIKVKQRGRTKTVFFKIDRDTDLIIGSGLY